MFTYKTKWRLMKRTCLSRYKAHKDLLYSRANLSIGLFIYYLFIYYLLRDKYARAKKSTKEDNKSGISAKAIKKARDKLESLAFIQLLDNYIKQRKSKNNDEILSEVSDDETNENEAGMDVSVSPPINPGLEDGQEDSDSELKTPTQSKKQVAKKKKMKKQSSEATKCERIERLTKASDIEKEEIAVLRLVVAAAQVDGHRDEFEVFGELVARKMRKLSHVINEDAMKLVEHNINIALMNARGNHVRNGAPCYLGNTQQGNAMSYMSIPGNTQQGNAMSNMSMLN